MQLYASWSMMGVVTERRELTSEKNKSWRGYVVKVATLGATFEVQVTPEQYGQIAYGQSLELSGRLEEQQGRMRLVLVKFAEPGKSGRLAS